MLRVQRTACLVLVLHSATSIGCSSSPDKAPSQPAGTAVVGDAASQALDAAPTPVGTDAGAPSAGEDSGVSLAGGDGGVESSPSGDGTAPGPTPPDGGALGDGGTVTCGTTPTAFDVTRIGRVEQMSVGPDGTLYYSPVPLGPNLGRYAPPYANIEPTWRTIPDTTAQILGIALDPSRNVLYGGTRANGQTSGTIYKIPLDGSPISVLVTLTEGRFNGLTIGEDAALYYTNQSSTPALANLYRVTPDGTKTQVNATPLLEGNDLAFGPDGLLYVNQFAVGGVTRLQLQAGKEISRETFVTFGGPMGDGIAFDALGNFYAADRGLYKVTPARQSTLVPGVAAASGMEFGCGLLSCNDLFISTNQGVVKYTAPAPGMNVPWHRR